MSNPVPVIPLQYAHVGLVPQWRSRLRILAASAWLTSLLAWILILTYDVKSVVVTGPVLFLLGLLLLLVALAAGATRYLILAATHCAICLLFFMLVRRFDWSPEQATRPFILMGGFYTTMMGLITIRVWRGGVREREAIVNSCISGRGR